VIISEDGYIITNNHVIRQADEIEVTLYDNRTYTANLLGKDRMTDLALLKIDEKDLTFIQFGNSDSVQVGSWALAVGNPFNLSSTVTAGIVSAKARNINILKDQSAIESFIQTDAAVNPGNSGGALVNLEGKLIGINTAIASPTGTYAGYAFAVPVNIAKKVVNDLKKYGMVQRGYLGIFIRDMNSKLAEKMETDITSGVYVDSIMPGSAAEEAGMQKKDIILSIDREDVKNSAELQGLLGQKQPGDEVTVKLWRDGKTITLETTLKNRRGSTELVKKEDISKMDKLGISISTLSKTEQKRLNVDGGVKVVDISQGIVSKQTKMQEGFVITAVDRERVKTAEEFEKVIEKKEGGVMVQGVYPGYAQTFYYAFGLGGE
jgi:Do/DeqQ family serine protease